jgi:hypothetical protein
MRIHEIIFPNKDPHERNRPVPQRNVPSYPYDNDLSKLASAFTKHGVVKRFWYLNGSEDQPSEQPRRLELSSCRATTWSRL